MTFAMGVVTRSLSKSIYVYSRESWDGNRWNQKQMGMEWNVIIPTDDSSMIFQRGRYTTSQDMKISRSCQVLNSS